MCPSSLGFLNVIAILLCGGQLWSYFNGIKAQEKVCTLALPPRERHVEVMGIA